MKDRTKIIALCTSRIYDSQLQGFVEILNESLKEKGVRLWIYAINADIYWNEEKLTAEIHVFDYIPYDVVDAVIIMDEKIKSTTVSHNIISAATANNVPVIVVDGHYDGTVSITYDYAAGFEQIVRHVIEDHGVKNPHYMAGFEGNKFSEERKEVFIKVLNDNGIAFDDSMVSYGEFWATPARLATQKLIDEKRVPEAIICANDIMAINVCDVLKTAGYSVPGDCIVTGFDGYDEALISEPAITTASCKSQGLASTVFRAVMECLDGMGKPEYSVLPVMITNESCGCERNTSSDIALKKNFNNNFYRFQDDIREYQSIAVAMQSSTTREEMMICLHSYFTRNMCCIVNSDCFRSDINFFLEKEHSDKYRVLYDSLKYSAYPDHFDLKDIVPEYEERMESGYPLIFNGLDYMGKPFGYVCYMFENYDIIDYSKTSSLTETVDSGLGGYINMQYQHYLMAKLEQTYKTDALTGLYNRMAAQAAFERVKTDPEKQGTRFYVIMCDLDGLKKINDTLGHASGDIAIAAVADALRSSCPEGTVCVRFGGDEMLAFVVGECDCDAVIADIQKKLAKKSEETGIRISSSCGYCDAILTADTDIDAVIRMADKEMYQKKAENKNRT
ncbi:MAG: GGDEF domain-containing protein [Lachnospiraceae bacterium]|nr:GGDEF domain-containing protein [Lachnospiraceae bacterium]